MTTQTGTNNNDTLTFVTGDTAIDGLTGQDTLRFNQTDADLTSTTLVSIEILKAGTSSATTFTVNTTAPTDLLSGGSVIGSSGSDTLTIVGTSYNLTSTTLTSIEILQAGSSNATAFALDQADIASGGAINGSTSAGDTITINGTSLNLASTTLSGIEGLIAGKSTATTFTIDTSDLTGLASITGSSGTDTLVVRGDADLTSVTLTSIEAMKAGLSTATTFTLDAADFALIRSISGSSGSDTLILQQTAFDLGSTTVTSVEHLTAGVTDATTFTLDQADLANGGTVHGTGEDDTLTIAGTSLNLTSTSLDSVEILKAGTTKATTFAINLFDLASGGSVIGSSGNDSLIINSTLFDLTSTTLTSVEILKAGLATATDFVLDATDLLSGGSVIGGSGLDSLTVNDASIDLSSTSLSSIEKLFAGTTDATTFTLDQGDLAANGSITGTAQDDVIEAAGTALDLSSTTLDSIEKLTAGNALATTFTVNANDLASGGTVSGSSGNDSLVVKSTAINLASTTLTSIEILKAGLATATTFTVDSGDLLSGGSVIGSTGVDTLTVLGTAFDLNSTALTSIEKLVAATTNSTTFTLNQNDLAAGGSVVGHSAGTDVILAGGTALNLSSTTLTSIEQLKAGTVSDTVLTVNQAQLNALAISGSSGNDTLQMAGALFDLTSTTLTSIEKLGAATVAATTFKVDAADLAAGGSVIGNTGTDTLSIAGTTFNLSSTSLTSIERLVAATSNSTLFTVNQADLASGGSIVGSTSVDTLQIAGSALNLSSTMLTSIERLQAGTTSPTTFTVDQADLAANGTVIGNSGSDTLTASGTALNLTSTTLSSVEILSSVHSLGTTFTLDVTDLGSVGTITGSTGTGDTLVVLSSVIDLSGKAVTGVETLKAGLNIATTFTVDQADLASGGAVIGSTGIDTLVGAGTSLDLSSTTLTSIETLQAGNSLATTFTVNQADLAAGGAINGSSGDDTLAAAGSNLDLTSTTLTSIEKLASTHSAGTKFTLDINDLAGFGSITGSTGAADSLAVTNAAINLTGIAISGIETLRAGLAAATTFTVDDTSAFSAIVGSTGVDTLISNGSDFDLSGTTLTSIEILKAGSSGTNATTFTVDQADLVSNGTIIGTGNNDTVAAAAAALDLTSTTLTSIEIIASSQSSGTTFKVDQTDLAAGGTVAGHSSGSDTLTVNSSAIDLTSTTLTSIETLKAGKSVATTFTVDQADLLSGGSVVGSSGVDTLAVNGASLNLASTALSSIEILKAASGAGTTFTVDANDLASGGSVVGHSSGSDILTAAGVTLDLTSTTLTSIERLTAGSSSGTTFTVDQADLASGGSVAGHSSGSDVLVINGTSLNLASTTLSSVEILRAAKSTGTTFTVDQTDLAAGGSVEGHTSATDTLLVNAASLDLSSTTLSSIEILKAGLTTATTFIVDQADLAGGGTVVGSSSTGDQLTAKGTSLDLSNTTLSGVEILAAGSNLATTFTVNQADLLAGGSVAGSSGNDTLASVGNSLNLGSTTLSSIEILAANLSTGTTFTVDQADLKSGGTVAGHSSGSDTLAANGASLDLGSTTLSSIDIVKAGLSIATTFTLDLADATGITVRGSSGSDTLIVNGTVFDLSSTAIDSVETLKAATSTDTVFTLDQADLVAGGTVQGSSGVDEVIANGATLDLSSTTLVDIERLSAHLSSGTTFTLDQADLKSGGTVAGHSSGADILVIAGTSLDLGSTTLSSIETLKAGKSLATTFTVDQSDLAASGTGGAVIGSSGSDILLVTGAALNLTSTALTSIEILKAGSAAGTTFTLDQADLASGGTVVGHTSGTDTLTISGASLDLSSTSLTSVEILKAGSSSGTTFIVDQGDLLSGGTVAGHSSGTDTLVIHGTGLDLSSTTLSSVEVLRTDSSLGTTFTVDAGDLLSGGSVLGHSSGIDTLTTRSASVDLTSTTLSSIEILKSSVSTDTTFTVDQSDLASGGSVIGSSGDDTLIVKGNTIDLSSTTLSSIETIETSTPSNGTLFTIGAGQGGATVELTANGETDTIAFAGTYKATTIANDATILAHTLVIGHFADGAGGDVIDISALTNGTPAHSLDISGYIGLANPATLKDALNLAAAGDGHTLSTVVTFQYGGDTYVLVDRSAATTLGADDAVIKLVGTKTLVDGDNFSF